MKVHFNIFLFLFCKTGSSATNNLRKLEDRRFESNYWIKWIATQFTIIQNAPYNFIQMWHLWFYKCKFTKKLYSKVNSVITTKPYNPG